MVRFKNGLPFEEEESSSTNLGTIFYWIISSDILGDIIFCACVHGICLSSEYTKFAGIPGVIPSLGFSFGPSLPGVVICHFWNVQLFWWRLPPKSASQTIPKKSLRILPHQTSVSWHPNIFKFGGSVKIGEPKPHPRKFNLGKSFKVILEPLTLENAKRPFVFLVLFLGDDWLKHIKTY